MTDINNILKKLESVKEVPKAQKHGTLKHTWKPILDYVTEKGLVRISEDDIAIQSALNGLNKEAKLQNIKVALNTRKINGKVWLFIQIPRTNPKK